MMFMADKVNEDENVLLLQLKSGDRIAFERIYKIHHFQLIGHLLRLLKSKELAQEVAQETFVTLWEKRELLQEDLPLKPYLYKIATNLTFDIFKKANHDEKYRTYLFKAVDEGYDHIESLILAKEKKDLLNNILELMPQRQREIFISCKIVGKGYREVAQELNISTHTVHTQIKRANLFIKTYLKKHPDLVVLLLFSASGLVY